MNVTWNKQDERKLSAPRARRGGTRREEKKERIAMNDVCMYFVTRIIVDLSSCGLPRPSLATEFKASIYKEWTNAMAAPTRRIGSECTHTRTREHACSRDICTHASEIFRIVLTQYGLLRLLHFISKLNVTEELIVMNTFGPFDIFTGEAMW